MHSIRPAMIRRLILLCLLSGCGCLLRAGESPPIPFRDTRLPLYQRVQDLLDRLTIDEKISQLMMATPGVPRLGIPAYDWWNEGLHGVARNGNATVFPQAIGLAATWDTDLHGRIASVISTEARAKNNELIRNAGGASPRYQGLTIWSPNINIFRDPRWGRGQETYGEDPFLTGRFAVAFVRGLQGDDPRYLKTVSTLKHFAVHSGPEQLRHRFNAVISERDLHETYLPAFEAGVRYGGVSSLMSSYNAVDGVPSPANRRLLTDILRRDWGFRGAVVGDVDAVADIYNAEGHHFARDAAEASADAIKAGTDLCSGTTYQALPEALRRGLVTEDDIDQALGRLLRLRFRLGQFDPPGAVAYTAIPISEVDSAAHDALALTASRESLVLLKNDGVLPWDPAKIKTVAIIGPTADSMPALLGNYNGTPVRPVTLLAGIRARLARLGITVLYEPGVPLVSGLGQQAGAPNVPADAAPSLDRAMAAGRRADHIVLVLGLTPDVEGEEMRLEAEGFHGGDRTSILLPAPQRELLNAVAALGKPVTVVLTTGSALSFDVSKAGAVLVAWYYGQRGGDAVAEALLGETNPAGRLPVTFYRADSDLPPFEDYSMANRTYRYFAGKPLYAFGHGLSYTTFAYDGIGASQGEAKAEDTLAVRVRVRNTGSRDGDEVVEVYARAEHPPVPMPLEWLVGFRRVTIRAGASVSVEIPVRIGEFRRWDDAAGGYTVDPGAYEIAAGPSSDNLPCTTVVTVR